MAKAASPKPSPPDQAAAHEFLTELRTRISTQPLPYQFGVESRALESLWEIFGHARSAIKKYPGCEEFARRTTEMLNLDLRPVTAKWHRAHSEGRLNSRDGANEFRADLEEVREKLRAFARELHTMAYGRPAEDKLTPEPMDDAALAFCFADLPFGIPQGALVDNFHDVNADEAKAIAARREKFGLAQDQKNAVGLGLSGGGIRSATFCLGVTQVLADRNLLKDVDFLSTVSGGGYLGCFLTTRLEDEKASSRLAAPHGPDPEPIRYLRQRAKFLAADNLKERWMMVTATLAGMVLNWTAPLFLVAFAALAAVGATHALGNSILPWRNILLASSVATLISLLVYAFRMRYTERTGGLVLGAFAALTVVIALLWLLTLAYARWVGITLKFNWEIAGVAGAVATAFPAIVRFLPILRKPAVRQIVLKVMLVIAGLVIPIGAVLLMFLFYRHGVRSIESSAAVLSPFRYVPGWVVLAALTALFFLVAFFLLNINLTAPHRLYRDQLARTFIRRWDGSTGAPIPLQQINPNGFAPYHLINATVNLPSSTDVKLRERRSDFFLFSKDWCGAPSIGYKKTSAWQAGSAPIDLATAMAVSGAAASSYMGLGSFPSLTALLTFLNVRLGYWLRRPGGHVSPILALARFREMVESAMAEKAPWVNVVATPGFTCLIREMFGIGMSEKEAWVNLSDGGHIENMAIYELLRRRCKFIISVDGEADPQSTFHGHLTLVRHAQIDFGIRIEPDLTALRPDLTSKFSQSHIMMCRVHYPKLGDQPAGIGLILYLKLSVTGNELEMIKRYRALNPDFPHQSTLDQFFDEEQFEAYRQLGVHVAEGLFSPALVGNSGPPTTTPDLFRRLAKNSLLPER